jgi:hypothetical protein
VTVASLYRVPLAGGVLEPPTPFRDVGTVLGVPGPILGQDQPEAAAREQGERLGIVGQLDHGARVLVRRDNCLVEVTREAEASVPVDKLSIWLGKISHHRPVGTDTISAAA